MPHSKEVVSCEEWGLCQFKLSDDELDVNRQGLAEARAAIEKLKRSDGLLGGSRSEGVLS